MNWITSIFKRNKKTNLIEIDFNALPKKARSNHGLGIIVDYAKKAGYSVIKVDYATGMIRYMSGGVCINFYTTSGTITTEIFHPKKGKTQLHRKGLSMSELKSIFDNPRKHTGKGYYKK